MNNFLEFMVMMLHTFPGFSSFCRDRKTKSGSGVLAFIENNLCLQRRIVVENKDVEILCFEACQFKSKRSIVIGTIY